MPPTAAQLRQARRLFAKALETPGGLKIQTIHAFCERLLHAFPFEANVPGQFQVMDDSAAAAALAAARDQVMDAAASAPASQLGRAVRALAERTADQQIGEALDAVIAKRDALRRWIENAAPAAEAGSIDDALADLRARLGLDPDETEETVCRAICDAPGWRDEDCRALARALSESLVEAPHSWNERAHPELVAILRAAAPASESAARLRFFLSYGSKDKAWRAHTQRFGADFARSSPPITRRSGGRARSTSPT
jgi:ATP-dependent helicase/nuclease subunit A